MVSEYFEKITKSESTSIDLLDKIIKEFINTGKLSTYDEQKLASAAISVIKNYKKEVFTSSQLPQVVVYLAGSAAKSDKKKVDFCVLVRKTDGCIFSLNYAGIDKKSLSDMWKVAKSILPDLTEPKHKSMFLKWAEKYGFEKSAVDKTHFKNNESVNITKTTDTSAVNEPKINTKEYDGGSSNGDTAESAKDIDAHQNKDTESVDNVSVSNEQKPDLASDISLEEESLSDVSANELYNSLRQDMLKNQEAIITAFTGMIMPVSKAFESIQGEITKSHEIGAENTSLKTKMAGLEYKLTEQTASLKAANDSITSLQVEINELKKQISSLESQNSELDSKLNDAYAINSREASLEAEKIRLDLKKAFTFLYEDWLEYETSDVSEENYESLRAIIKKIFRALERNGIDFKGNSL